MLAKSLSSTEKVLAMAEKATPPPDPRENDFDRPSDQTILRLNTEAAVHKVDVLETISDWLQTDFKPESYRLQGPDVGAGRFWILKFNGAAVIAARLADKARKILRKKDDEWEVLKVSSPGTKDKANILYVSVDKSPKQGRTETLGKKFFNVFKQMYPTRNVYFIKRTGTTAEGGEAIARICSEFDGSSAIEWNKVPPRSPVDKAKLTESFRKVTEQKVVQWERI